MLTLDLVLLILALSCFIAAAVGVTARVNLTATGLALWVLTQVV